MDQLTCGKCGCVSQSDGVIKVCPVCDTPNPDHHEPTGNATAEASSSAPAPAPAAAAVTISSPVESGGGASAPAAASAPPPAAPAAPAAPVETTAVKVEKNVEIALEDVNAVADLIAKDFSGTPIATIFRLLGPAAGIGAAVLHQHLMHSGFDLSNLKDLPTV